MANFLFQVAVAAVVVLVAIIYWRSRDTDWAFHITPFTRKPVMRRRINGRTEWRSLTDDERRTYWAALKPTELSDL